MLSRRAFCGSSVAGALSSQTKMFADAEAYEQFMGRWSRIAAPLLVDFAKLSAANNVLDVGSGTGALSFAVAERNLRTGVTGVDPSNEYVSYAVSRNRWPDRVSFHVGDAQTLQFPDETFDAAVSLLVFNFIPDAGKALSEVKRVTRAGGTASAAVWDYGEGMQMLRVFWDAAVTVDPQAARLDEKHMPLCRRGELSAFWKTGGLANVHEEPIDIQMQFSSFDDYWNAFLLGQGPAGAYAARLDQKSRQSLRTEVHRRLDLKQDDKPFKLSARVWAVRGFVGQ